MNAAVLKDKSICIIALLHHIFIISPVGNVAETYIIVEEKGNEE